MTFNKPTKSGGGIPQTNGRATEMVSHLPRTRPLAGARSDAIDQGVLAQKGREFATDARGINTEKKTLALH